MLKGKTIVITGGSRGIGQAIGERAARDGASIAIWAKTDQPLSREAALCSGNFFIDEAVLREEGVTDFDQYAVTPGSELFPDFFL